MPKKEFIEEFEYIRGKLLEVGEESQEYYKFKRLYKWCQRHYRKNFQYQKNSLKKPKYRNTVY